MVNAPQQREGASYESKLLGEPRSRPSSKAKPASASDAHSDQENVWRLHRCCIGAL